MPYVKIKNLQGKEGKKGDTGTLAHAEAMTVAADQPAAVEMYGPESDRGARFYIPRGLPGVNAVPSDEFIAGVMAALDTEAGAALRAVIREQSPTVNIRDFGAVGDGLTDDTAAVQAFFDFLVANSAHGVAEGTFRVVQTIQILDPTKPFKFTGSGVGSCTFLADHAEKSNVFTIRASKNTSLDGFTVDGGSAAMTGHGISAYNCNDTTIGDVEVKNYSGTPILFFKHGLFPGASTRNHIVRCKANGGLVAANGFMLENSSFSTMRDVEVYDLDRNAVPSYALQLKNDCVSCMILGGIVDHAGVGVAFGYDEAAAGSQTNNVISGVTVRNCYRGLVGSWARGNQIQLTVDMMDDPACTHAVYLAGHANHNHVDVTVLRPAAGSTVIYVQEDYNLIALSSLDALGTARLAEFASTAVGNYLDVGPIGDRSAVNIAAVSVLDSGTNNRVRFRANDELHASPGGQSVLRFTSLQNQTTFLSYSHASHTYLFRANGVDAISMNAERLAPGVQDAQSLGYAGRRWKEVHTRDGVILNSPDGSAWRITVNDSGALSAVRP